jgi:hypothetical protein
MPAGLDFGKVQYVLGRRSSVLGLVLYLLKLYYKV